MKKLNALERTTINFTLNLLRKENKMDEFLTSLVSQHFNDAIMLFESGLLTKEEFARAKVIINNR